ncbi:PIN domain-like protein [Melanogaster broomeanus]|nr:PIN domain-like protein [Melanogaster broomeanus]
MGITNLWEAVAPVAKTCSLLELTALMLASGWLNANTPSDMGMPSPVVFDGPEKPPFKRGKKVISTPPWLTEHFKRFASAFGFETHVAAGEAEAELATFNCQGLIDAVWTEDSDALVFDPRVTLTKGGLLLMALFCGGDYDKGLPHCGWKTTGSLAQQGLGDELLHAAETMDKEALTKFISCWVKHVRDLLAEMGHENKRYQMLSENFPENFPSPAIVLAYVKPATTDAGHAHIPLPLSCPMSTDLEQLAFLCEFHFGWSRGGPPVPVHAIESSGTLGKLQHLVWEGMCICALCEMGGIDNPGPSSLYRLEIDTTPFALPAK